MNTQMLEEIGLTKNEIKIYLALLKEGQTTTTYLIKECSLNPSKVYENLDRLVAKGLVTYVVKSNKKHFTAVDPDYLTEFLREKQRKIEDQKVELKDVISELNLLKAKANDKINFQIYEGQRGIKSFYEKFLSEMDEGDTSHLLGAPKMANDLLEGFLLDWHKRRIKKKVKLKGIFDLDNKVYGKVREKMKYSEVRYTRHSSPSWIEVSLDYVATGVVKGSNMVMFVVKDKEIAKSYLDYFNLIWKISEK